MIVVFALSSFVSLVIFVILFVCALAMCFGIVWFHALTGIHSLRMRTVIVMGKMAALGFVTGMIVLFGYNSVVPHSQNQMSVENRGVTPATESRSTGKAVRQDGKRLEPNSTVPMKHIEQKVEEINATIKHVAPLNVISNSTMKIYRIQDELPDVTNDTYSTMKELEIPLQTNKLSQSTTKQSFTHACSATETDKPSPVLTKCLLESIHTIPDEAFPDDLRIFNPTFSIDVHMELLELLEVFQRTMTSHNLTFFLQGGTLIGSWRHHGFIPWDDDIDVFMDVEDKPRLKVIVMPRKQIHIRYVVIFPI